MNHARLNFIVLCDGPCSDSSFKPNDDRSQWWSRRDALVRICSSSLWQTVATPNEFCENIFLLFNKLEVKKYKNRNADGGTLPCLWINGRRAVSAIPVPTEHCLIKGWKKSFIAHSSASPIEYHEYSNECQTASSSGTQFQSKSMDGLDKREILKIVQSTCDLDFLRTHGLSGAENLVLKKRNRNAVLQAYELWCKQQQSGGSLNDEQCVSQDASVVMKAMTSIVSKCMHIPFTTSSSSSEESITTLLLLHEDYPHELPVFGDDVAFPFLDTRQCQPNSHGIICALGAVRDCSDEEVHALMSVSAARNIRVVGANLGRTAEFTSKIITALVAHNTCGRLDLAVRRLPSLSLPATSTSGQTNGKLLVHAPIQKLNPIRGWTWDGHRSSTTKTPEVKDVSNNYNDASSLKRELDDADEVLATKVGNKKGKQEYHSISEIISISRGPSSGTVPLLSHHFWVAAWVDALPHEILDEFDADSTCDKFNVHASRQKEYKNAHMYHQTEGDGIDKRWSPSVRERMYGLVQLVVNTLWRSRIGSEYTKETPSSDTSTSNDPIILPVLFVVFQDHSIARLTQKDMAVAMAALHMAAPSEYQVLHMLMSLLQRQDIFIKKPKSGCSNRQEQFEEELSYLLPKGLSKSEKKATRIVQLMDVDSVLCGDRAPVAELSEIKVTDVLSQVVYEDVCACSTCGESVESGRTEVGSPHVLVLLRNAYNGHLDDASVYRTVYAWRKHEKTGNWWEFRKEMSASMLKKVDGVYAVSCVMPSDLGVGCGDRKGTLSCGKAIGILQHWAYHGRLMPTIIASCRRKYNMYTS